MKRMKIWIDLTNSPHINFFKPFIKQWENEGYEIFLTARNLANTIELIQQNSWIYKEIGGHAGKNKFRDCPWHRYSCLSPPNLTIHS